MWLLTLKSILVATDLDEASHPALLTAAHLAPLAGARLHLLHVTNESTRDGDTRLREHFRLAAPDATRPETARAIPGSPADAIVDYAGRVEADAVILGPHRRGITEGEVGEMGSTAASVVRTAPCPCLVAVTELRLPLERVLVPIDLSGVAGGALSVALSWASALRPPGGGVHLTVLHVTADPSAIQAVREEIERARERAGEAAHVEIREVVTAGSDPAGEIVRAAASEAADLVVMGTRGAAGAAPRLGSVSAAVARATPCPLLLVPPATWSERGVR